MRRRSRVGKHAIVAFLGVLLSLVGGTVIGSSLAGDLPPPLAPAAAVAGSGSEGEVTPQFDRAFGYRLGEERRYVLEPQKSLRPGESAWWSIVLDDIQGEGDEMRIVFRLDHQRSELIRDMFGGANGRMQVVDVSGTLTVNRFGFPERLVINEQHDVSGEVGSQSDIRTTRFTFDGERLVKQVRIEGHEWQFNVSIAGDDDLDLEVPYGLYAYVPTGLACLGSPGTPGRPSRCLAGDPAFANPGLLSLALPVMWEEQVNEKQFLFFMPSGVGTLPAGLMDINGWVRRERDTLNNYTRYFDKTKLEIKDYEQGVEIGPRTVDAWRFDGNGQMGEFYADADGTVLKVDIDPHPVTYGQRWIRLLYPSEY